MVTVDHVYGPSAQVCDTIGNAKAYVLGHTTSYDTFEEFDAALKGSIDAIDGVINYSIEKQEAKNTVKEIARHFPYLISLDYKTVDLESELEKLGYLIVGHDYVSYEYADIAAYYGFEIEKI